MSPDDVTNEAAAEKTDYRGLVLPFAAAGAVLAAWTIWWFVAASQVELRVDEELAGLRAQGWTAEVSGMNVAGWPFRLFVTTDETRLVSPRGSGIHAEGLRAEAAAYDLNKWVIAAPEGATILRGAQGATLVTGRAVRASVVRLKDAAVPRATVELLEPKFAAAPGAAPFPLVSAEVLDLYLRPSDGGGAEFLLRVENGSPEASSDLFRVTGGAPLTLRAEGLIPQPSLPLSAVERMRAALSSGPLRVDAESDRLEVDGGGRVAGRVALDLKGAQAAIAALGAYPGVDPRAASAAAEALGDGAARTQLSFADGRGRLAGVDLGPAPKVR